MAKQDVFKMSKSDMEDYFEGLTPNQLVDFISKTKTEIAKLAKSSSDDAKQEVANRKKILEYIQDTYEISEDNKDLTMAIMELEERRSEIVKKGAEASKDLVDGLKTSIESIPLLGNLVSSFFDWNKIGLSLQKEVLSGFEGIKGRLFSAVPAAGAVNAALTAGIGLIVAGLIALIAYFKQARAISKDMSVSMMQAAKITPTITSAQARLVLIGQDAKEISGELLDTFGTTAALTYDNITAVGDLAFKFGATSKEIIAVQKNLTDLFGMQVDQTEEVIKNIGKLAESQGVAAGAVISDMASSSEKFAEFAQDGAMGFAQAAIEARKVGANVSSILGAADKLLGFEESITAQFKAQVLTGKQINLENARRLALEGDFLGLTTEIQSIVGEIGDIQTMNVIERRAIADAIGISVQDLQKISRGEQMEQQMTVQDKLDITNKLLAAGNDLSKEQRDAILEGATRQQNQNLFGI